MSLTRNLLLALALIAVAVAAVAGATAATGKHAAATGVAAAAFTLSSPHAAGPDGITPPPLPDGMAPVPEGNKLFLGTHAAGTQNYVCQPSGAGVAYVLFTPQ